MDVDRIFYSLTAGEYEFWAFEIKHKYPNVPAYGQPAYFGLNLGEQAVLERLLACDIKIMHTILVKPVWDDTVSTMSMYTNNKLRDAALLIYRIFDAPYMDTLRSRPVLQSGGKTTVTGRGKLSYRALPVNEFYEIGPFSAPQSETASALAHILRTSAATGEIGVTTRRLHSLRQQNF